MNKLEIRTEAQAMQNLDDLVVLLNKIRKDVYPNYKTRITKKQLVHLSNSNIVSKRYKTFEIRKKSGGTRQINAPCSQLKIILNLLNVLLKSLYTPKDCVMGFAEGRNVVNNAAVHVGHNYVLNIDLENFFPSIPQARVWARIQCPPFCFVRPIANIVAGLCCFSNSNNTGNVLPQGAPTSPILTNAVCDRLDYLMLGVAKRFGLHYSRYADDMTFSSMHNVYQENGIFMLELKRIIDNQGFRMNEKKTRLLNNGQRQEVTGLTVNNCVNVARKYVRFLRLLLHIWETEGYGKAYSWFYPRYKKEKGYIKKGEPVMENVIGGKLNYLRMVKGEGNAAYQKLLVRYNKLQQVVFVDTETDLGKSYIYVQPYPLKDFERDFATTISLQVSTRNKLIGKCLLANMDKTIAISKTTQDFLCDNLGDLQPGEKVTSDDLKNCFVTLCRNRGKNFWLITKFEPHRSRCLSIQNVEMDIDNLLLAWEQEGIKTAANYFEKALRHEQVPFVLPNEWLESFELKPSRSDKSKNN